MVDLIAALPLSSQLFLLCLAVIGGGIDDAGDDADHDDNGDSSKPARDFRPPVCNEGHGIGFADLRHSRAPTP